MRKIFLFATILLSSCSNGPSNGPLCKDKESCLSDSKCLCWCSQICNFRKKLPTDHPMFVEGDANGKFCYCKQWDYDHYQDNCIQGKKLKEPKDAL